MEVRRQHAHASRRTRQDIVPQEPGRPDGSRPPEHRRGRAGRLETPIEQQADTVAEEKPLLPVVRDMDRGSARRSENMAKLRPKLPLQLDVNRSERLIEENETRPGSQGARERDALELSARKLVRSTVLESREVQQLDEPPHLFLHFPKGPVS